MTFSSNLECMYARVRHLKDEAELRRITANISTRPPFGKCTSDFRTHQALVNSESIGWTNTRITRVPPDQRQVDLNKRVCFFVCGMDEKHGKASKSWRHLPQPRRLWFRFHPQLAGDCPIRPHAQFDRLLPAEGDKTVCFGEIGQNSRKLLDYSERNGSRKCGNLENPAGYMLEVIDASATGRGHTRLAEGGKQARRPGLSRMTLTAFIARSRTNPPQVTAKLMGRTKSPCLSPRSSTISPTAPSRSSGARRYIWAELLPGPRRCQKKLSSAIILGNKSIRLP